MLDRDYVQHLSKMFEGMLSFECSSEFKFGLATVLFGGGVIGICSSNSRYRLLGIISTASGLLLVCHEALKNLDPLYVPIPKDFCEREEFGINYVSSHVHSSSEQYTAPISLGNSSFSFFSDCVTKLSMNIKQVFSNETCATWEVRTPLMKFTNWVCACVRESGDFVDIKSKSASGYYDLHHFNQKIVDEIETHCGLSINSI